MQTFSVSATQCYVLDGSSTRADRPKADPRPSAGFRYSTAEDRAQTSINIMIDLLLLLEIEMPTGPDARGIPPSRPSWKNTVITKTKLSGNTKYIWWAYLSSTVVLVLRIVFQRKSAIGAARTPKVAEKKTECPVDPCRDPITLDDLGSWTWDFRASEAATPPVSCGGTRPCSKGGGGGGVGAVEVDKEKGGRGLVAARGRRGGGGGGRGGRGAVSSNAVVTYNVESLVLYLLESGDFQVCFV